ncbi:hypothetical protein D1007_38886 [Hordeum vulgare]|nr:hypothetical protein D1007_38886 [Hordeum vulgare]
MKGFAIKIHITAPKLLIVGIRFFGGLENDHNFNINKMCMRDNLLWRARFPMVFLYIVEWHFVDRVAMQFGKIQDIPIEESKDTITKLHRFSRRNNQDI